MADSASAPPGLTRESEEAGFYHEAGLNATWTGVRLALGGLSFAFGCFVFAYFYLRSLNSNDHWDPAGFVGPQQAEGAVIMVLVVVSALLQWAGLTRIKAGQKGTWLRAAVLALTAGLAAIGLQIWQLFNLPFQPGAAGIASVFVGATPVFIVVLFSLMVWLETLIMRARRIRDIHFVEQPPTYAEAFALQRFQASLSALTVALNYLAAIAILFWVLFYLTA